MMTIRSFNLGIMQNNSYLIANQSTKKAAIIDPSFGSEMILQAAEEDGLMISHLLFTHAHFDHIVGLCAIFDQITEKPQIALHPADLAIWQERGHARDFGIDFPALPKPGFLLDDHSEIIIGTTKLLAIHTPGHTPGHTVFYIKDENILFSGDLLFNRGIGRTDLPGGDWDQLKESILKKVFILPQSTRVLPGHGPETTVGEELEFNPFLK